MLGYAVPKTIHHGAVALRPDRPAAVRGLAWVAALATFGWIVSVAIRKHPLGALGRGAADPHPAHHPAAD